MICCLSYVFWSLCGSDLSRLRGHGWLRSWLFRGIPFEGDREAFGALLDLVSDFIRFGDNSKETLESFLEEAEFHIFVAPPEEKVDLDPVPLLEPCGGFCCLDAHVVVGC